MQKNVLLLCDDNSSLSIIAEAVLSKYLKGVQAQSAGLKKVKPLNQAVKKALQKDGSWSENFHAKNFTSLGANSFDLVIILSSISEKQMPEFDEDTAANSLADALPNIVDKATPEGESLLDQVGGLDGLMNMAGKLFGKS